MRRSFNANFDDLATKWPTYEEHPEPLSYSLPFSGADLIGFRRRWSEPGRMVSQHELGELLGLGQRQIHRYESGVSKVDKLIVLALAHVDELLCAAKAEQAAREEASAAATAAALAAEAARGCGA